MPLSLPGKQEITTSLLFACPRRERSVSLKLTVVQIMALFMFQASVSRKLWKKQSCFYEQGERGELWSYQSYTLMRLLYPMRQSQRVGKWEREYKREELVETQKHPAVSFSQLWEVNVPKRTSQSGRIIRGKAVGGCSPSFLCCKYI